MRIAEEEKLLARLRIFQRHAAGIAGFGIGKQPADTVLCEQLLRRPDKGLKTIERQAAEAERHGSCASRNASFTSRAWGASSTRFLRCALLLRGFCQGLRPPA